MGPHRARIVGAALLLVIGVGLAFGGAASSGFVGFDDGHYVSENRVVGRGLTLDGIAWAFTTFHESNWHPLTWISHMLDVSLFGVEADAQHVVNLVVHAVSAVMLMLLLLRWGLGLVAAFLAASLFAWHPLRVESVVWIAERKDVLSVAFGLATLHTWTSWRRGGGLGVLIATHLCYAASLLSKPTLVTLPCLLVLLEFWPLGQARTLSVALHSTLRRAWGLFALALGSGLVTYLAQASGGSVSPESELGLAARLSNAAVSVAVYLRQTCWPAGLSVFYPHARAVETGPMFLALALVIALSALAWRARRALPAAAVGWAWFLGSLVPMLGLVQVGLQSHADRYTYWPSIGLALGLATLGAHLTSSSARSVASAAAAGALIACVFVARTQTEHWRDGVALFEHARASVPDHPLVRLSLGNAYFAAHDLPRAAEHFEATLRLDPRFPEARNNLGSVYTLQGRLDEARAQFEAALQAGHDGATLRSNLGILHLRSSRFAEAAREFERALAFDPEHFIARLKLGLALGMCGQPRAALPHLEYADALQPDDLEVCRALGLTYFLLGRESDAVASYRRALRRDPLDLETLKGLAWLLAMAENVSVRDARAALELAELATARSPGDDARAYDVLGAARAENGDFAGAVTATERALELYRAAGRADAVAQVERRLDAYRAGRVAH